MGELADSDARCDGAQAAIATCPSYLVAKEEVPRFAINVAMHWRGKTVLMTDIRPGTLLVGAGGWALLLHATLDVIFTIWPDLRAILHWMCF